MSIKTAPTTLSLTLVYSGSVTGLDDLSRALQDASWASLKTTQLDAITDLSEQTGEADCLLLAGMDLAQWSESAMRQVSAIVAPCPVIVLCPRAQESEARWLAAGAEDCVDAYSLDSGTVLRIIRRAVERSAQRVHISTAERQYEDLFRKMPVAAFSVDASAKISRANEAFLQLIGAGDVTVVSDEHLSNLLGDLAGMATDADAPSCDYNKNHIVNTLSGDQRHVVVFARRKQSHAEVDVFLTDVTHKELQSRRVAKAENRLRRLYDAVPVMMFSLNQAIQIVDPNRSFLTATGRGQANAAEVALSSLIHPDSDNLTDIGTGEGAELACCARDLEVALVHVDGQKLECLYNASPQQDMHGNVVGAHVMMIDVTERNRAQRERDALQEQLQLTQKLESIGELAAGIAHEINTPAQYVSDNLSFLDEAFGDLAPLFEQLEPLANSLAASDAFAAQGKTLATHIDDADLEYICEEAPIALKQGQEGIAKIREIVLALKDFSHPGGADMEQTDLNRIMTSTATVARNEWKYVANLHFELQEDLPMVPCFASAISQVVLNILVNAAHAIGDAKEAAKDTTLGNIRISTALSEGNAAIIRIQDDGPGIPEAIRQKIFDPFFTTKQVGKGTGQGLAISRRVVTEQHNGTLSVESVVGEGTTFTIGLPLDQPSGSAIDEAAA